MTLVDIPHAKKEIGYNDPIVSIGSCFADNITQRLQSAFFQVSSNPFGTLYNPQSIANCLQLLQRAKDSSVDEVMGGIPIVEHGGLWHSMMHHGSFSSSNKDVLLQRVRESITSGVEQLEQAKVVIITLGTAWVYEQDGKVVSNCHKIPARKFNRRCMRVEEIEEVYREVLQLPLLRGKHIIFTVSPIRHQKDGMHSNQISKSVLLLAIEQLGNLNLELDYFPSYEIVLDELRDYRFYADDMLHPSAKAVDYIWERFKQTYFSKETMEDVVGLQRLYAELHHTPLHPETEEYRRFRARVEEEVRMWGMKYPWIR